MSVTKDFDQMLAEASGKRPTFKIGGQEFTLRSKLPYARWNRLLADMRDDDVTPEQSNESFFSTVLIRADRARFLELLDQEDSDDEDDDDDENVIDLSQIDSLITWAMEHFTGKLRSSTGGSSPGSSSTGQSPNVVSLQSKQAANA